MDPVREVLGDYPVSSVRRLATGTDNVAYEVNGDLIVRFRRRDAGQGSPSAAASIPQSVEQEAALLRLVARVSPLAVPVPFVVDAERGCLAYRRLPGVPLLALLWPELSQSQAQPQSQSEVPPRSQTHAQPQGQPQPDRQSRRQPPHAQALPSQSLPRAALGATAAEAVGTALGAFLGALHAVPVADVAGLVGTDETSPQEWLDEAVETWSRVHGDLPAAGVEAFLGRPAPPPGNELVFSHQDLGIEHVLVDPVSGAVTGVIDWTDAGVGDPAYDLALILRDLGPWALEAALRACGRGDAALRERAAFYARCGLIEDLAYGQETGHSEYARKSVAALGWLFN
jgi:aminoglycoside phosphotransferase